MPQLFVGTSFSESPQRMTHHVYSLSGLPDATYVGITCLEISEKQRLLKSSPPKWLKQEFSADVLKKCKVVAVTGRRVSKAQALALEAATVAEQLGSGAYCRGGFFAILARLRCQSLLFFNTRPTEGPCVTNKRYMPHQSISWEGLHSEQLLWLFFG